MEQKPQKIPYFGPSKNPPPIIVGPLGIHPPPPKSTRLFRMGPIWVFMMQGNEHQKTKGSWIAKRFLWFYIKIMYMCACVSVYVYECVYVHECVWVFVCVQVWVRALRSELLISSEIVLHITLASENRISDNQRIWLSLTTHNVCYCHDLCIYVVIIAREEYA